MKKILKLYIGQTMVEKIALGGCSLNGGSAGLTPCLSSWKSAKADS
jgi:hypothetical protein